jgi:uncharacterized RDD family membrane protein YckC
MNNETPLTDPSPDILSEYDVGYQYATRGQRFLNYLIDNLLMRFGLSYLTGILLGLFLQTFFPDYLYEIASDESSGSSVFTTNYLLALILAYFNYIVYYTICEKLFQGYTLGKLITGTKAVRLDGTALSFKDALLRSLSRIVPFEVFSGFGIPWHDSWTNTTVIKTR